MFSYAFEKGYLPKELKVKRPSPEKDARRPSFTKDEWRKLTVGMRRRFKDGWGAHKRDRFILNQYVLILANCGVRLGELRNIKWSDVRRETYDDDGANTVRLIILVKGKTGIREVVCNKGTEVFFERLYDNRKEELNAHPSPDTSCSVIKMEHPSKPCVRHSTVCWTTSTSRRTRWERTAPFTHFATCMRPSV
jgi:integrase